MTMTVGAKVFAAEVFLFLFVAGRVLCLPGLHHARPATSFSYFSMALPAHHHAPAAAAAAASAPLFVSHAPPALPAADDEDGDGDYLHHDDEPILIAHPKYSFKYGVEDSHTGDYKHAKEERDGDVVTGEYSLLQPDGRTRTVHYTASKHGGFNAVVSYSGHAIHPDQHVEHYEDHGDY